MVKKEEEEEKCWLALCLFVHTVNTLLENTIFDIYAG